MPAAVAIERSFLDANVLFSAAYSERSIVRRIWTFNPDQVVLLTSEYAIDEARRNVPDRALAELAAILRAVQTVPTPRRREIGSSCLISRFRPRINRSFKLPSPRVQRTLSPGIASTSAATSGSGSARSW